MPLRGLDGEISVYSFVKERCEDKQEVRVCDMIMNGEECFEENGEYIMAQTLVLREKKEHT